MANNTRLNLNSTIGDLIATEDIGGVKYEMIKLLFGSAGVATMVSASDPLPVGGAELESIDDEVTLINSKTPFLGQSNMAGSVPVVIASDQVVDVLGEVEITSFPSSGSSSVTSVNDSNTNQTLLSADPSRKMAIIFNDSTEILYVKLGATATTTDYSFQVQPKGYFEMPAQAYSGQIDGIWAANASGAAKITQY